jgi:hypothetical protein
MTTARVIKDNTAEVMKAIELLANTRVMVGVPAEEALRQPEPGEKSTPINNAALAYIHENGAPEAKIPPRPFLKPAVAGMSDEIASRLNTIADAALNGRPEAVSKGFHALGLRAQAAVRNKINEGVPPPLSPVTIKRRLAKGRTGTKPLIDTGQLRNAITYVIRMVRPA